MAEVEELLREGKRLGLQLKGLPKLISMMAQARSFNMRARRALKKGTFPDLSGQTLLRLCHGHGLQGMHALQRILALLSCCSA